MAWKVGGVVAVVVVVVAATVVLALMPRSSGAGWYLDRSATWDAERPDNAFEAVVVYGSDATSVGIGVTVTGSSSCPPELRGVEIDARTVRVAIGEPIVFGACTADAALHQFGIVVERDRLPDPPFSAVVSHAGYPDVTVEIESLP
jgi:hypothetical protein